MKRILLTLLTLVLLSIACTVQVPNTQKPPTATVAPFLTRTPNALGTATNAWTATVKRAQINVRNEPDGDTVVGYLKAGNTVTVIRCIGDWCKIEKPSGWVFKGCLTIDSNLGCEAK